MGPFAPVQVVWPAAHATLHTPPAQIWPPAHALPQAPQLLLSFVMLAQKGVAPASLQRVCPVMHAVGVMHVPAVQT
jgi:hypothetical protein